MADQEAYVLSYRRDNTDEDDRLDWQHELIKHLIWGGRLIQESVPLSTLINDHSRIADVGCGTGIWLKEVGDMLSNSAGILDAVGNNNAAPRLVGFDTNPRAFRYDSKSSMIAPHHLLQSTLVNLTWLISAVLRMQYRKKNSYFLSTTQFSS